VPEKPVHALFDPHEEVFANEIDVLSRVLSMTANRMKKQRFKVGAMLSFWGRQYQA
jgi:hypothetical protein